LAARRKRADAGALSVEETMIHRLAPASHRFGRTLWIGTATLVALAGCSDVSGDPRATGPEFSKGPEHGTFYGAATPLGEGRARTYIVIEDGLPTEIGVALTEAALRGLPAGHDDDDGTHSGHIAYLLPMHPQNPTPYQFAELDWNPHGHEPMQIYGVPHFDFHFYTISPAERAAIDSADPLFVQKARNLPPTEYVPQGYVDAATFLGVPAEAVIVPQMGLHWIDPKTPELNGAPFTHSFFFGSWDGRVIFGEPMISNAFLATRPDVIAPIAQPEKYSPAGYYPGSYRIYWDAQRKEIRVALIDFVEKS
jgi:hypothetical protein